MTATYTENVVQGEYRQPVKGADVYLLNEDGSLATTVGLNPTVTDTYGFFTFTAADGVYLRDVRVAGVSYARDSILVGSPPQFTGATGPANSTYTSLTALKAASSTNASYILTTATGPITYAYVSGDFTGKADDTNVVKLNAVALATGALVRQSASAVSFTTDDTAALVRPAQTKIRELPRSPEDLGTIQSAIDAAQAAPEYGEVKLPKATYLVTETTTVDSIKASLLRGSMLDARNLAADKPVLRVDGSVDGNPLGNCFGYKIALEDIRLARGGAIVGVGGAFVGIGLDLNGTHEAGSAQVVASRLAIAGHATGMRFANRAYNSSFSHCEVWSCITAIHWAAGGIDNGERNNFSECVIHDSDYAILAEEPSGSIYFNGSIDFCKSLAKTDGGKIFLTDTHMESATLGLADGYALYAGGDGGLISINGGFLLNQATAMPIPTLGYMEDGAAIEINGTFIHNLQLTRPTANTPTAFFGGPGIGIIRNIHSFAATAFPDRLHQGRTSLVDQEGSMVGFKDLSWIDPRTTGTTTDRYTNSSLTLTKSTSNPQTGPRGIAITKSTGIGIAASVGLMWIPVEYAQMVFAGFYYAKNAAAPATGTISVVWLWAKFDDFDDNDVPTFLDEQPIGEGSTLYPASTYQMCAFGGGFGNRVAPYNTTHLVCRIDLDAMSEGAVNIGSRWIDAA